MLLGETFKEIDELREIEKRLAVVLNEVNEWVESPNVEDSQPYQTYVTKRSTKMELFLFLSLYSCHSYH